MSLDVYLELDREVDKPAKIYVREGGRVIALNHEEWADRYPNREPIMSSEETTCEVYTANITHNLSKMAHAAGLYEHLWRPDEVGIDTAKQLIIPLAEGLRILRADPDRFREFNPENGWGTYEGLVEFVQDYLRACRDWPDAKVRVWR